MTVGATAMLVAVGSGMVLAGAVLMVVALLGWSGRLPRQSWVGIRTRSSTRSAAAWRRAHRAAAGHLAVSAVASAGFGVVVLADALVGSPTVAGGGSAVLGVVTLVAGLVEATARAAREARQTVD